MNVAGRGVEYDRIFVFLVSVEDFPNMREGFAYVYDYAEIFPYKTYQREIRRNIFGLRRIVN